MLIEVPHHRHIVVPFVVQNLEKLRGLVTYRVINSFITVTYEVYFLSLWCGREAECRISIAAHNSTFLNDFNLLDEINLNEVEHRLSHFRLSQGGKKGGTECWCGPSPR